MAHKLCRRHFAEYIAWLDYKIQVPAGPIGQSGPASVGRVIAERATRFRDWRRTVRTEHKLITEACEAGRGCSDNPEEAFS